MENNFPVSIKEIEEATSLSWTGVKKVVLKIHDDYHLNLRKSGGTWIVWKEIGPLKRKISDSCHQFLE